MWCGFGALVLILVVIAFGQATNPTVQTPYGTVEGFNYQMASGNNAEIFLGIPFAAPPVGDLRFEKPQEPQKWTNILQANKFKTACATFDNFSGLPSPSNEDENKTTVIPTTDDEFLGHSENEDCLYLNILKPKEVSKDKNGYPIMFFVYGGGFTVGDAKTYGYKNISDNIVSQGIIVVIIQYRLGPFGFFTTGDSRIPGNFGLWDQLEALKFTNKVIRSFNGDKNRITIAGVSAGGASVSLLALSEEAYNLYAQVFPMSGSGFAQFTTQNPILNISRKLAYDLGCDKNSIDIKKCLKSKKVSEFQNILKPLIRLGVREDMNVTSFGPRMDGDFIKAKNLEEAAAKAPIKPTLIGVCSQEAIIYSTAMPGFALPGKYFNLSPEAAKNYSESDLKEFVKVILAQNFGEKKDNFIQEVTDFYVNQTDDIDPNFNYLFEQYTSLISDLNFNVPALRETNLRAKNGNPTFFYVFDYNLDTSGIFPAYTRGASHGADVVNLFGGLYNQVIPSDEGLKVQKAYVEFIGNFIKNGIPSIGSTNLPTITPTSFSYMHFDAKPSIKKDLWKTRLEFWNYIGQKYGFDLPSGLYINNTEKGFSTHGLIDFIGPYRTTISSLNLLIIIILYSRVLKKPASKVNTINPNTVTASTRVFTIVTS